jgi:hypothetical protein
MDYYSYAKPVFQMQGKSCDREIIKRMGGYSSAHKFPVIATFRKQSYVMWHEIASSGKAPASQ